MHSIKPVNAAVKLSATQSAKKHFVATHWKKLPKILVRLEPLLLSYSLNYTKSTDLS